MQPEVLELEVGEDLPLQNTLDPFDVDESTFLTEMVSLVNEFEASRHDTARVVIVVRCCSLLDGVSWKYITSLAGEAATSHLVPSN